MARQHMSDSAGVIHAPWLSQNPTRRTLPPTRDEDGTSTILQHSEIEKPLPDAAGVRIEIRRVLAIQQSRTGQIDGDDVRDRPRTRCHDDNPIRQKDGLVDAVRDKYRGLPL